MTESTQGSTDRFGLEVLPPEECDRLLARGTIGRIAFVAAGEPVIVPVNYRYHRGAIVLRTAQGEKLDAAGLAAPCAFEIDHWDETTRQGWSVLVKGTMEEVYRPDEVAELETLGVRPWSNPAARHIWIRIRPDEISGRRLR